LQLVRGRSLAGLCNTHNAGILHEATCTFDIYYI
jgi:hypothetical protein